MNTITTVTNETTGAIIQTTIIHHEIFDYRWFILAMAGFALVALAAGVLTVSDPIKDSTPTALDELRALGVNVLMLNLALDKSAPAKP